MPDELDRLQVAATVRGRPVELGGPVQEVTCAHDREVLVQCTTGFVHAEHPPQQVIGWQLRVRAQCADCATVFSISDQGRLPADGEPGVVVTMEPMGNGPAGIAPGVTE